MVTEQEFNAAAEKVKNLPKKPTDEELLEIYGLFKQVTVGDNNTSKPGMLDFKGKAKWEAWTSRKGMVKEEAMAAYVDKANTLCATYS